MLSNYEINSMRKESVLVALYKKELKRFFSSTVYVINSGMGVVMALAFALAIVVVGPSQLIAYPELSPVAKGCSICYCSSDFDDVYNMCVIVFRRKKCMDY